VGVSEFPDLRELPVEREAVTSEEIRARLQSSLDSLDPAAHREHLLALARSVNDTQRAPGALTESCVTAMSAGADIYSVATVVQHGQPDFHLEPIPQWRAAELWEQLRSRAERMAERPRAFLANLGPISSHGARSTWATNLLASAGIDALGNDGFDEMAVLGDAYRASLASIAVVCGSDRDYEAMLDGAVGVLADARCPVLLVAGRPGEREASLRETGVADFVFVGADVLDIMTRVLDSIGAPP
jgi:methylmalonyl-CoA mutase